MRSLFTACVSLIVVSICLVCRPTDCRGGDSNGTPSEQATLKTFLQKVDDSSDTEYVAAFRDLNGDGVDEAIVYLLGNNWCGSGGCNMLVLSQERGSWKVVSTITIVRPPVRVLEGSSDGWHNIGVWVQGGGVRRGYEAELSFNGKTYSRNPSVPSAKRAAQGVSGETVIAEPLQTKPLRKS
jgi:hypothetical protein